MGCGNSTKTYNTIQDRKVENKVSFDIKTSLINPPTSHRQRRRGMIQPEMDNLPTI